jgi:hypothetical protein
VDTADEVRSFDPTVGEECPAVRAAALEHVHDTAAPHQHEVDTVGFRVGRDVVDELDEAGDREQACVHL